MSQIDLKIGPKIKSFRRQLGLQANRLAEQLGISASYLNLIERNQRPITVQLILKLSKTYNISPEELEGDADGTVTALKEIFLGLMTNGKNHSIISYDLLKLLGLYSLK